LEAEPHCGVIRRGLCTADGRAIGKLYNWGLPRRLGDSGGKNEAALALKTKAVSANT